MKFNATITLTPLQLAEIVGKALSVDPKTVKFKLETKSVNCESWKEFAGATVAVEIDHAVHDDFASSMHFPPGDR